MKNGIKISPQASETYKKIVELADRRATLKPYGKSAFAENLLERSGGITRAVSFNGVNLLQRASFNARMKYDTLVDVGGLEETKYTEMLLQDKYSHYNVFSQDYGAINEELKNLILNIDYENTHEYVEKAHRFFATRFILPITSLSVFKEYKFEYLEMNPEDINKSKYEFLAAQIEAENDPAGQEKIVTKMEMERYGSKSNISPYFVAQLSDVDWVKDFCLTAIGLKKHKEIIKLEEHLANNLPYLSHYLSRAFHSFFFSSDGKCITYRNDSNRSLVDKESSRSSSFLFNEYNREYTQFRTITDVLHGMMSLLHWDISQMRSEIMFIASILLDRYSANFYYNY